MQDLKVGDFILFKPQSGKVWKILQLTATPPSEQDRNALRPMWIHNSWDACEKGYVRGVNVHTRAYEQAGEDFYRYRNRNEIKVCLDLDTVIKLDKDIKEIKASSLKAIVSLYAVTGKTKIGEDDVFFANVSRKTNRVHSVINFPNEEGVKLFVDWAKEKGYSVDHRKHNAVKHTYYLYEEQIDDSGKES